MHALLVLAIAGTLSSITAIVIHGSASRRDIIALVLSLASLGIALYQLWQGKKDPSTEQEESVADTVRNKTALWVGLIGIVLVSVILLAQLIRGISM
jgi:multidrug transporter EmrE-like cation transporter